MGSSSNILGTFSFWKKLCCQGGKKNEISVRLLENLKPYLKIAKVCCLLVLWLVSSYFLMANSEKDKETHKLIIYKNKPLSFDLYEKPKDNKIKVMLTGRILPPYYAKLTNEHLDVWVQLMITKELPSGTNKIKDSDIILLQNVSEVWRLPLATHELGSDIPKMEYSRVLHLIPYSPRNYKNHTLRIQFNTNLHSNFSVSMQYNLQPTNPTDGVLYAALILTGLYGMIIFDVVHRTLASMLATTVSIATLAAFDQRPSIAELVSWMDMETLILLFSMMTIVSIFNETGVFDFVAVLAFKKTKGKLWPLINTLCILTTICSCFLDSVTTALLVTPVIIKLCEVMKLDPIQILLYSIIFANIGGTLTPIGDPPNVIIANNPDVKKAGVNFGLFTLHMGTGAVIALIVAYIHIRILYNDMKHYQYKEPAQIQELKNEIAAWERTAASVSNYSKEEGHVKESLLKQLAELQTKLKDTTAGNIFSSGEKFQMDFEKLKQDYPIKNKSLLIKSGCTLLLVITVFFFNSIPEFCKLGLGWTALLGTILLLVLYDKPDIEGIFARVEWCTLVFFASLFILMEALSRLGLIEWVGKQTQSIITSVSPDHRLAVAIVLILWVSAIVSIFVDNLPLTSMMIRIAVDLAKNEDLHLPLQPLIWALSYGACLGGNGSLLGSSSNIICAGVAEQHGYKISFTRFTRIGLPVMCTTTIIISVYLLCCHVLWDWH